MNEEYNVYVWDEFFPDWSPGLAVVIATSEREAFDLIKADCGFDDMTDEEFSDDAGPFSVHPIGNFVAQVFGGA